MPDHAPQLLDQYWPQYELPPVGMIRPQDHQRVSSYINRRKQECHAERSKWTPMRDHCLSLYNTGELSELAQVAPADKATTNHLQNGCLRVKDVLLRDPPLVEVKPLDDGAGVFAWYYNGPAQVPQQGAPVIDPITGQPKIDPRTMQPIMGAAIKVDAYQFFGIKPPALDTVTGEMVAEPIEELDAARVEGMLEQLKWPSKWLLGLDAKAMGDLYQKPFDYDWKETHVREWSSSYGLEVIKAGWADAVYLYDQDGHAIWSLSVLQAFLDPSKQFVWEMDCHVEVPYPINLAMKLFPEYAKKLFDASHEGPPTLSTGETAGYADQRDFQSRRVVLSISWLRDEPMPRPMTPQDAKRKGLTELVEEKQALPTEDVMQQLPTQAPAPVQTLVDVASRQPLTPDEEGNVWHDSWPMRKVLRQIVMLDNEVLEDDEAPYPVPNLIHATCIGQERNPYGWGLVWKPRFAQETYSRGGRAIDRNTQYYGNAAQWTTQSIDLATKKQGETAFIDPGTRVVIPDKLIPASGKLNFFIDPPPIPESLITARRECKADLDELMGVQDALRGTPVTPDASGELQKTVEAAAVGLISAIGEQITGSLEHVAKLMMHSIVHYCDVEHIYSCCRKYTREVTAAIHLRHAPQVKWTTPVTLASGAQQAAQRRKDEMIALGAQVNLATGMPRLDGETILEGFNFDPDTVRDRLKREVMDKAELQAELAPPVPVGSDGKPVPPPSSNGNGHPNGNGKSFAGRLS